MRGIRLHTQTKKSTIFSTIYSTFYDISMKTITLQSIKTRGAKAIPNDMPVYLIVNSQTKSVIVPPEEYEMLVNALEELEDMKIIAERKTEKSVGWDDVFPSK